jgi:ribonuclease VapC
MVLGEEDAERYETAINEAISRAERLFLPASVIVEAGAVLDSRGRGAALDRLLDGLEPIIVAVDEKIAWAARRAYRAFGKGFHPAKLNFGDCLSYAVCAELGETLLFKGNDFAKTDIRPAL